MAVDDVAIAGTWTCTSYDARGRVAQVVVPESDSIAVGRTVTTTYRVGGDPYTTAVTDPAGTITTTVVVQWSDQTGRAQGAGGGVEQGCQPRVLGGNLVELVAA